MARKNQLLHKAAFEGVHPDGTLVSYISRGQILLEGYIEGSTIKCQCCAEKVTPSRFEFHAGCASRRKPYAYIYTADGKSLHESMTALTKGQMYSAKGEKLVEENADADSGGYDKCGKPDFTKMFGPRAIIICDQCDKKHHVRCLESDSNMKELPKEKWFCSSKCKNIHLTLQHLQVRGAEKLSESLLGVVRKKYENASLDAAVKRDVRWQIVSTKIISNDTKKLLSQALTILQESFDPIIDSETQRNLIPPMVYGKNVAGRDFRGLCCAVLTVDSYVVSCGIFRIFGPKVAELPLVATQTGYHEKGYFQLLYSCIEKLLSYMDVEKLVLPATKQAERMWVQKFDYMRMSSNQVIKLTNEFSNMLIFEGTSMLYKPVPSYQLV